MATYGALPSAVILMAIVVASMMAAGSESPVAAIHFEDNVVYDSSDLGVCGVNYVVERSLSIEQLILSVDLGDPRVIRDAPPGELESLLRSVREAVASALADSGVEGRVFVGHVRAAGGQLPFAVVSVPESVDVSGLAEALRSSVSAIEEEAGVSVAVVVQVLPEDLMRAVDVKDLRSAVKALQQAVARVASSGDAALEGWEAELAVALDALGGPSGRAMVSYIEWPEPEFGDPLYVSVDVVVDEASISKDSVKALVRAIRGIIGCDHPLVVGLATHPVVKPDVIKVSNPVQSGTNPSQAGEGTPQEKGVEEILAEDRWMAALVPASLALAALLVAARKSGIP